MVSGIIDPCSCHDYCVRREQEEHGHVVMLGIFDCIDDTVLVKKALLGVSFNTPLNAFCSSTTLLDGRN